MQKHAAFALVFLVIALASASGAAFGDTWWLRLAMATMTIVTAWASGQLWEQGSHAE